MLQELLAELAPDWETDGYGDSSCLVCPHGVTLEQDGWHWDLDGVHVSEGTAGAVKCESPLRTMGLM